MLVNARKGRRGMRWKEVRVKNREKIEICITGEGAIRRGSISEKGLQRFFKGGMRPADTEVQEKAQRKRGLGTGFAPKAP